MTNMNCRGLWQLSVCCRRNYNLLTRKGPDLKFLPESLGLKFEISKRYFTSETDSGFNNYISPSNIQQVLLDLKSEQDAGFKWKRFPVLNKLLKGHRGGELTVFTGPTGSDKTTFLSEYSLDLCMQGVNTLWGSFENNERLREIMLTQFAQQKLAENKELSGAYADLFQNLPMYFMTLHRQESIEKAFNAVSQAVYVHDIAHVVLDNLQFMVGVRGMEWNDHFMEQEPIIAACRKLATDMYCHVTLVIPPKEEEAIEDLMTRSAMATQVADNVLILQDERLTSVQGKKYLQVTKNRFGGDLGVMLLNFNKESLSFAGQEKRENNQAN